MDAFAANLKKRIKDLGLSNAEAARLIDLSERRFGHYVTGIREPDLGLVVRIAQALRTTPNDLLGLTEGKRPQTKKSLMQDRLARASDVMGDKELEIMVIAAEAVARAHR